MDALPATKSLPPFVQSHTNLLLRVAQNTYNPFMMIRCASFLVVILVFAAILTPASAAGGPRLGKIKGLVVDTNQARVFRAEILILGGGRRWRLTTNEEGEFETSLPTGEYQFSVEADGFRRFSSQIFAIKSGKTQRFNIKMKVAQPINLTPAKSDSQSD